MMMMMMKYTNTHFNISFQDNQGKVAPEWRHSGFYWSEG